MKCQRLLGLLPRICVIGVLLTHGNPGAADMDRYEPDDRSSQASVVWVIDPALVPSGLPEHLADEIPQNRTIHTSADEDWVEFYVEPNEWVEIRVIPDHADLDLEIQLYSADGVKLKNADWNFSGKEEILSYYAEAGPQGQGYSYLAKILAHDLPGDSAALPYRLLVYHPYLAFPANLYGRVTDAGTGEPLTNVLVQSARGSRTPNNVEGWYILPHAPGRFSFTAADRSGQYAPLAQDVTLAELTWVQSDFSLTSKSSPVSTVAAVGFEPAGGTFDGPVTVTLSSSTQGAEIRYTTDNSVPDCSAGSALSNGATLTLDRPLILKALACKDGWNPSAIGSESFTINTTQPSTGNTVLTNLSTRSEVGNGASVMVGGIILQGDQPKSIFIRAQGPSLGDLGFPKILSNPELTLFSGSTILERNDDWGDHPRASAISQLPWAPKNSLESAILRDLEPGAYTVRVNGRDGATGIGIIAVYNLNAGAENAVLESLSTRAQVRKDSGVLVAGFVIEGEGARQVFIRARGPSLEQAGISDYLRDPKLILFSGQSELAVNDDWETAANAQAIAALKWAPGDAKEPAILTTLQPGQYTARVLGADDGVGIGIVEVHLLD